jgi:outer membrane protein assembly factor BamD (BamD/ComL family)
MNMKRRNLVTVRFRIAYLVPCCLTLLIASTVPAQESTAAAQPESDYELLLKAEADLKPTSFCFGNRPDCAIRAHKTLKNILLRNPHSAYRFQILEDMKQPEEVLGQHNLLIAAYYMKKASRGQAGLKGAESRLLQIVNEYPYFSRMDEVLLRLGDLAALDERVEDASRYLWTLICNYPESRLSASAFSQLNQIASRPFQGCEKSMVQSRH